MSAHLEILDVLFHKVGFMDDNNGASRGVQVSEVKLVLALLNIVRSLKPHVPVKNVIINIVFNTLLSQSFM